MNIAYIFTLTYYSVLLLFILAFIAHRNRYWLIRNFTKTIIIEFNPNPFKLGDWVSFPNSDSHYMYVGKNRFKAVKHGKTKH